MMTAVRFLFDVADKKREFLDCSTCKRGEAACPTCPIDQQPSLTPSIKTYFDLWRRTREYGSLPAAGGLLDQEERVMRILDKISAERNRRDAAAREAARRRAESKRGGSR